VAATVLEALATDSVPVDLVACSTAAGVDGVHEFRMGFTLRRSQLAEVEPTLRRVLPGLDADMEIDAEVGKVSLVGTGLLNRPEHTARLLAALAATGVSPSWISTAQSRTSVLVPLDRVRESVGTLHREFNPDRDSFDVEPMAPV
jgi:aspartate kinase